MRTAGSRFILSLVLLFFMGSSFAYDCEKVNEQLSGKWTYSQNEVKHAIEFHHGGKQVTHDGKQKEMWGCYITMFGAPKVSFYLKNDLTSYSIYLPEKEIGLGGENLKLEIGFKKFDLVPYQESKTAPESVHSYFRWEPIIGMDEQIFPSLIIATATWSDNDKKKLQNNKVFKEAEIIGDPNGMVSVVIQNIEPGTNIKVEVSFGSLANPSVFEDVLEEENKVYVVRPRLDYDYQALLSVKQPTPLNAKIILYVNGEKLGEKIKTVRVRSINDAPRAFLTGSNGEFVDYKWMFAAYVNENHPWIDQLLREAINTGVIDGLYGYQNGAKGVYQQVFSIWNVLQRRGVRYSSITTPTGHSNMVFSQYVRFFEDSINTSQANCIDGTVLFASILRRVGINSQIVLIPGHAFLRFNLNESGNQHAYLETTMMGHTNLEKYGDESSLRGILGMQTKNQASANSFIQALNEGGRKANIAASKLRLGNDPNYQLIDIEEARKLGVSPINH